MDLNCLKTVRNPGGPVSTYVSRYLPACGTTEVRYGLWTTTVVVCIIYHT